MDHAQNAAFLASYEARRKQILDTTAAHFGYVHDGIDSLVVHLDKKYYVQRYEGFDDMVVILGDDGRTLRTFVPAHAPLERDGAVLYVQYAEGWGDWLFVLDSSNQIEQPNDDR